MQHTLHQDMFKFGNDIIEVGLSKLRFKVRHHWRYLSRNAPKDIISAPTPTPIAHGQSLVPTEGSHQLFCQPGQGQLHEQLRSFQDWKCG